MSYMTMDLSKLQENYRTLSTEFERRGVSWAIVTKLLCGNREYLKAVLSLGASQVCDSRVLNLKAIKKIDPSVETVFIKPPAKKMVPNVIRCADISLNTQVSTIKLLSDEAVLQGKAVASRFRTRPPRRRIRSPYSLCIRRYLGYMRS